MAHSALTSNVGRTNTAASNSATSNTTTTQLVDPYQVLQVRRDATVQEIRQAYKRLALLYHPGLRTIQETNNNPQERARRRQVFEVLAACYETLMDKTTRTRYDALLKEAEQRSRPPNASNSHPSSPRRYKKRLLVGRLKQTDSMDSHHYPPGILPSLSTVSAGSSTDGSESTSSSNDYSAAAAAAKSNFSSNQPNALSSTKHQKGGATESSFDDSHRSFCSHASIQRQQQKHKQTGQQCARYLHHFFFGAPSSQEEDDDGDTDDNYYNQQHNNNNNNHNSCFGRDNNDGGDERQQQKNNPNNQHTAKSKIRASPPSSCASSEIHYSERETNRLFGGPLFLLFRARRWKPLTDPYQVFAEVFGTDLMMVMNTTASSSASALTSSAINNNNTNPATSRLQPTSPAPAAVPLLRPLTGAGASSTSAHTWTRLPDGTMVCSTTRQFPDRILIRTETIYPHSDHQHRQITVTSEPIVKENDQESTARGRGRATSTPPPSSSSSCCGSFPAIMVTGGGCWTCDLQFCLSELLILDHN